MVRSHWALSLAAFASIPGVLASCGGKEDVSAPSVPACAMQTLTASPGTFVGTYSSNPKVSGSDFSLAATPAGDRLLALWRDDVGGAHRALIAVDGDGNASVTTLDVSDPADQQVAAYDGTGFDVLAGSSAGLVMQRLGLDGSANGAPLTLMPTTGVALAVPMPVTRTPSGLIVAWTGTYPPPGSPQAPETASLHATLIGPDGTLARDTVILSPATWDPYYGSPPIASFALSGNALVALAEGGDPSGNAFAAGLDWFGGPQATTALAGRFGNAWPLLSANGQLAFAMTEASGQAMLFTGPPGGPFAATWQVPEGAITQSVDACGRIVSLDVAGGADAGAGALYADSPTGPATHVLVGGASPGDDPSAAIVATSAGFAVLSADGNGNVQFAQLTWH